jgi:hypothetical protein
MRHNSENAPVQYSHIDGTPALLAIKRGGNIQGTVRIGTLQTGGALYCKILRKRFKSNGVVVGTILL